MLSSLLWLQPGPLAIPELKREHSTFGLRLQVNFKTYRLTRVALGGVNIEPGSMLSISGQRELASYRSLGCRCLLGLRLQDEETKDE